MFETGFLWSDAVGLAGVACVIGAYALLQLELVKSDGLRYLGLNLAGALLLIVSLTQTFNLASFVIEICWLSISVFGLVKTLMKRRKAAPRA